MRARQQSGWPSWPTTTAPIGPELTEGFTAAKADLAAWRKALEHAPEGSGQALLAEMREALAADLNAPAAVAAVSRWARTANDGADASAADAALVKKLRWTRSWASGSEASARRREKAGAWQGFLPARPPSS